MSKEIPSHLALTIDGQGSKDASGNREYDKTANEILSDPQIVSRIVCAFVPGFTRLTPEEVERECLIVPDHAGEQPVTRADRAIMRVNQQNGVDKTVSEGTAVFDVLTRLKGPGGNESMIIDLHLEEQTTEYLPYPIEKRALYYIARLLSIQGEDLVAEELYKLLHRVVSVWIILDPHAADRATVTHTHLVTDDIVGAAGHLPENTDLVDIFYLRLNKVNPGVSEGVLGMLEVLFSNTISADDKKQILENKYNMSMTTKIQKGVTNMSGLGEAIYQNGKADGMAHRAIA